MGEAGSRAFQPEPELTKSLGQFVEAKSGTSRVSVPTSVSDVPGPLDDQVYRAGGDDAHWPLVPSHLPERCRDFGPNPEQRRGQYERAACKTYKRQATPTHGKEPEGQRILLTATCIRGREASLNPSGSYGRHHYQHCKRRDKKNSRYA